MSDSANAPSESGKKKKHFKKKKGNQHGSVDKRKDEPNDVARADLPRLPYPNGDLKGFFRKMATMATTEIGIVGQSIMTLVEVKPEEPKRPEASELKDEITKNRYINAVKEYDRLIIKYKEDTIKVYGMLMGQAGLESKNLIMRTPDFQTKDLQ